MQKFAQRNFIPLFIVYKCHYKKPPIKYFPKNFTLGDVKHFFTEIEETINLNETEHFFSADMTLTRRTRIYVELNLYSPLFL